MISDELLAEAVNAAAGARGTPDAIIGGKSWIDR